jgi:hypothetical protein
MAYLVGCGSTILRREVVMDITAEQVKARMEQLERERQRLTANLNATIGAIQDCEYWLGVVEAESSEVEVLLAER